MQNIDPSVWVYESANLCGNLSIGEGSSVWPNVVMRAEMHHIQIDRMTNIEDFVMLHVGSDTPTIIGDFCSITHHCTIHGATIGDSCLIGINATIMDGAVIDAGSIVAGGAFVPEGKVYPPNSVVMGSPANIKVERDNHQANRMNAWLYNRNTDFYAQGRHDAWSSDDFDEWMAAKTAKVMANADIG